MTTTQPDTLVFKDQTGDYYLLPKELLEHGRVPAERTAELEGILGAATQGDAGAADAQGYALPLAFAFAGVILGGMAGGIALHRWATAPSEGGPSVDFSDREPLPLPGGGHGHF